MSVYATALLNNGPQLLRKGSSAVKHAAQSPLLGRSEPRGADAGSAILIHALTSKPLASKHAG